MTNYTSDHYFDDPEKQFHDDATEQFIRIQQQRALNESEEIKLRAKDSDLQASYAQKLLEHQSTLVARQPAEHRKTITRYGYGSMMALLAGIEYLL
jgi:hypothetical protein